MKLPAFDYAAPQTLAEAIDLLAANDNALPLAGGQSLIPILAFRLAAPSLLVDLRRIPGLDAIRVTLLCCIMHGSISKLVSLVDALGCSDAAETAKRRN